jgi:hypothetical protein
MSKNETILIAFAWTMEIVGVAGGVINSLYTVYGTDMPGSVMEFLPAVPLFALPLAEVGRVPLASVIYYKHKFIQCVAFLGIVALGYLAVENWTFGFERIVDLRLKSVNTARSELSRAEADLAALVERRRQMTTSSAQKRDELRRGIEQRDASIEQLTKQLREEAELHPEKSSGDSRSVSHHSGSMHGASLARRGQPLCYEGRAAKCRSRASR